MDFRPAPKPKKKRKGRAVRRDRNVAQAARDRDNTCLYGLLFRTGCVGMLSPHHLISFGSDPRHDVLENLICLCKKHHDQAEAHSIPSIVLRGVLYHFYGYGPDEHELPILDEMKKIAGEYGLTSVFVMYDGQLSFKAIGFASQFIKAYTWDEVYAPEFIRLFDSDLSSSQRVLNYG